MNNTFFLKPRLSEKTYGLSENLNVYVFEVPKEATKLTIADAIVAQYQVTPKKVRVTTIPGKTQRNYRKSARKYETGKRPDIKKAYVTLKEGDKLPIFAAVEEANQAAAKESK
jgi:large subunit ribosomal protein L23